MVVCMQCGVENPDGFRFCGGCGSALAAAIAERRERRVVSVVFADLVGFTRRSERPDVEDVERFLAPYHALPPAVSSGRVVWWPSPPPMV